MTRRKEAFYLSKHLSKQHNKMKFLCSTFTTILSLLAFTPCYAAPLEDLVEYLPDFGRPPTPHFSGYLDATAGCNTEANGNSCHLHYWLALAEEDPLTKPVVLWCKYCIVLLYFNSLYSVLGLALLSFDLVPLLSCTVRCQYIAIGIHCIVSISL